MRQVQYRAKRSDQAGIILIVAMVFLLLVGIVAFRATSSTILSEKIAGNQWEQSVAYQASEAALVDASGWLFQLEGLDKLEGSSSGANGIWEAGALSDKIYNPGYDWSDARTFGSDSGTSTTLFSDNYALPRHLVENVGVSWDNSGAEDRSQGYATLYFSITAVGFGVGDSSRAVLQTVVSKRPR